MLRWLVGQFAHSLARQKLAETVKRTAPPQPSDEPVAVDRQNENCALAVVVDGPAANEGLSDRLKHVVVTEAAGFTVRRGTLAGQCVVVAMAKNGDVAARVATGLIEAHHPAIVAAVGFAAALDASLKRGQLIIANRIVSPARKPFVIDVQGHADESRHFGTLVTVADVPADPPERRQLAETYSALAADRIAWPVAQACRQERTAMIAVHAISFEFDQDMPAEIQHLARQRSLAGKAGALVGGIVRRPSTVKDLWRRKQSHWQSSDHLADFLTRMLAG